MPVPDSDLPVFLRPVTGPEGALADAALLAAAEAVHRQLRPQLPANYRDAMERVFASGGEMCVAVQGDSVVGIAVWRVLHNTLSGPVMHIDDLVVDEACRSRGVGRALVRELEERAAHRGCVSLDLDSGTQRVQAHQFYFREGFVIKSFSFEKKLT